MEKEIVENPPVVEVPKDTMVIETAQDDIDKLGLTLEELQGKQESKPTDSANPEVKEDVKEVIKEEEPVKKSRSQRRIERQAQENKELKKELEELKSTKETPKVEKLVEPDMDNFDNYEDYEKALEFYEKKSNAKEVVKEIPKKEQEETKGDNRIVEAFEDGKEDYKDFEELVRAPDLQLSESLLNEALDSETPSDVLYYLASNKELTRKISSLDERGIKKEILKIELALENKQTVSKKVTNAPEPINPLNGGTEAVRTINDAKSYTEYENLRNATRKNEW